jgi:Flp pilus assembly pilin Flp
MNRNMRAYDRRGKFGRLLSSSQRAQTYTEYALIFVCVIVALIGGYQLMGNTINNTISNVNEQVSNA